ncbi:zinc finger protein 569-like [Culicoides brevitarsis]|uniref:zinc finger protein 569-like n=1 Tax=Culicoides brevitarsis TaxID=469753 RepID=UPI00307B8FD5
MEQNIECYTTLEWTTEEVPHEGQANSGSYIVETGNLNEIDPNHLIYMTEDGQRIGMDDLIEEEQGSPQEDGTSVDTYTQEECEITEEVVTQDWVQGDDCVQEVTVIDQIDPVEQNLNASDIIPLPEAQDEYTASRPYPCDFCSRRFRKKANLMNHMIAHQNDRPHGCNLCGARYIRKSDLLNHLKTHAYTEDGYNQEDQDLVNFLDEELNDSANRNSHSGKMNIDLEELLLSPGTFNSSINSFSHQQRSSNANRMKKPMSRPITKARQLPLHSTKVQKKRPKPKTHTMRMPTKLNVSNDEAEEAPTKFPVTNPSKPFVCQKCGVAFARSKALTSHMRFHTGDILHECTVCGQQFYDKVLYQKHHAKHFDETIDPPDLDSLSTFKEQPVVVKDEYDEEATESEREVGGNYEDTLFECQMCLISFHRADLFEKHMMAHETSALIKKSHDFSNSSLDVSREGHFCNVCGDQFEEALDLLAHAEVHARFQPLKCLLCGEQFNVESEIKMHINEMHRAELTENTCRLCGKLCKDGRTLMRHSWDHSTGDGNFSCARCAKTFHNKARLKRHMTSHKNKTVMCDTCGKELQDGRSLMNHKHLHTKSNQFHCTECGKTFGSRSSQQIHMRIHTGEKPYGCRYCEKAFADGGTLRKHERIHTGEKPYACPVCPRAFNQRVVLREHIRSHHSAPDLKLGTSVAPYFCPVCCDSFTNSQDLIKHLIEHSDANTQAKRQPLQGPRKYKRRRNLETFVGKRANPVRKSSSMDFDDDNLDDETTTSQEMSIEDYAAYSFRTLVPLKPILEDFRLPEQFVPENERPKAVFSNNSKTSRPKMIHTEKTRVATNDGSKRKTRSFISKTTKDVDYLTLAPPPSKLKPDDESFPLLDDGKPLTVDAPLTVDEELLREIGKSTKNFNSDVVNDLKEILQSPAKVPKVEVEEEESPGTTRRSRRSIKPTLKAMESPSIRTSYSSRIRIQPRKEVEIKQEVDLEDEQHDCEMCGDSFPSKGLLLAHAQIHM